MHFNLTNKEIFVICPIQKLKSLKYLVWSTTSKHCRYSEHMSLVLSYTVKI